MKGIMKHFRRLSRGAALLFAVFMFITLLGAEVMLAQSSRGGAAGTYSVLYRSWDCSFGHPRSAARQRQQSSRARRK